MAAPKTVPRIFSEANAQPFLRSGPNQHQNATTAAREMAEA